MYEYYIEMMGGSLGEGKGGGGFEGSRRRAGVSY